MVSGSLDLQKKKYYTSKTLNTDLSYLKMWLDFLFQEMRDSISSQNNQNGLRYDILFKLFIEQYKANNNPNLFEDSSIGIYVYINMIIAMIDRLTTGEEKENLLIVFDDVYPFLILAKSMSDFRENLFNNGSYSYNFIYSGIYDFLSTVLLYTDLLSKEYCTSDGRGVM